jgi:hypothetical protein
MTAAARRNYERRLPERGGLNRKASKARMSVQKKTGRDPSIAIRAVARGVALRPVDAGLIRHPVFQSNKRRDPPWVSQRIPAHSFTDAMIETAPEARKEIDHVLEDIGRKIDRAAN